MKLYMFAIFLFFPLFVCSTEIAIQYYPPSLLGITSGSTEMVSSFKNRESQTRFLIPFEIAAPLLYGLHGDKFSLSGNAILSTFIEDKKFSSLNLSIGSGFFYDIFQVGPPMKGLFFSIYPIYELPIIALGKSSRLAWRTALDAGYSFLFADVLRITLYSRYPFLWLKDGSFLVVVDFGVTFGFHFRFGR